MRKLFVVVLVLVAALCGWIVGQGGRPSGSAADAEVLAQQLRMAETALDRCEAGRKP